MNIDPSIFKTYDIRGVYPNQLDEKITQRIADAFISEFGPKTVVIGYDARAGSELLALAFIEELLTFGVNVTNIGLSSTPRLYFAAAKYNFEFGVIVTASHAAKEFTGLKFIEKGFPPNPQKIINIKNHVMENTNPNLEKPSKKGNYTTKDILQDYVAELRQFVKTSFKPLNLVVDCGNGVNGPIARRVFDKLGLGKISYLFEKIDPSFPNHENNPKIAQNREPLVKEILKTNSDLGIIWDGDSDRVYFLDHHGEVISPHFVSALIGEYLIPRNTSKKMTIEVRTGPVVNDLVEAVSGEIITIKAWHTEIKYLMEKDPDIIFGSETSGHYVFRDFYKSDDGVLAVLVFLAAISAKKDNLDTILKALRSRYHIIEEINFSVPDNTDIILKELSEKYQDAENQNFLDGLTVHYPDWRFNLRPSQTEPVIRLNLTANTAKLLEAKTKEISQFIQSRGGELAES